MNWQDAGGSIWNPTKDAEGNAKSQPTENDYVQGIYRGYQQRELKFGVRNVHKIQADIVNGEQKPQMIEVIGNKVLDDQLCDIMEGVPVYVKWDGKVKTQSGDSEYHSWTVKKDVDEEDRLRKEAAQGDAFKSPQGGGEEQGQGAPSQEGSKNGQSEDDDLPF